MRVRRTAPACLGCLPWSHVQLYADHWRRRLQVDVTDFYARNQYTFYRESVRSYKSWDKFGQICTLELTGYACHGRKHYSSPNDIVVVSLSRCAFVPFAPFQRVCYSFASLLLMHGCIWRVACRHFRSGRLSNESAPRSPRLSHFGAPSFFSWALCLFHLAPKPTTTGSAIAH
jgi:hypothetical protein